MNIITMGETKLNWFQRVVLQLTGIKLTPQSETSENDLYDYLPLIKETDVEHIKNLGKRIVADEKRLRDKLNDESMHIELTCADHYV